MRRYLILLLAIVALTFIFGFGTTDGTSTTGQDEFVALIEVGCDSIKPIQIFESNRLTVYQGDGYLKVKSEAVGEKYLLQIKSSDGLVSYEYIPYSIEFHTIPLPDSSKATLTLFEKTEGNLYKDLSSIEFFVHTKNELERYTMPNIFVYYEDNYLSVQTAKRIRNNSISDLEFVIRAFKLVAELPYDYEKFNNMDILPDYYIPNVEEVLISQTGICSDKATLLAAMLRSQGIPTKYVTGKVPTGAHAWNEVYIDDTWFSIDPTFETFWITSQYEVGFYK